MKFLSLFSGIGGFDLGLERAGMTCIGQVEINKFCLKVLEKHWPNVKRMEDIHDVKGNEFGTVDLICGGFPCQPFSVAGQRKGNKDDRYLWPEMDRVISLYKPDWFIGENVTGIINMELDQVLSDLESKGYICQTFIIPACAVNAWHRRDRVWIVANSGCKHGERTENRRKFKGQIPCQKNAFMPERPNKSYITEYDSNSMFNRLQGGGKESNSQGQAGLYSGENGEWNKNWIEVATEFCGVAHGVSNRIHRLKSLGNAVVPQIVEIIGRAIMEIESNR